jgi:hypothetical protein
MQVRRHNDTTLIDAVYVEEIEWLPTWKKPMEFVVGTNVRAPSASGIR